MKARGSIAEAAKKNEALHAEQVAEATAMFNQNFSAGRQTRGRTAIPAVGYLSDSQRPSGIQRNEIVKWQRMVSERIKSSLSSSFSRAPMAAMTSDGTQSERAKRTLSSLPSLSSPCLFSSSASSAGIHDGGNSTANFKSADQFRTNLRNSEDLSTSI